jgi:hypothetical protein
LTNPKPRDYFDALRALSERYFAVWPAERKAVLAEHKREEQALSAELGRSVQADADGIGEAVYADELLEHAVRVADPDGTRNNDLVLGRLFTWFRCEKGSAGVLGAKITFGDVPIFSPREVLSLKGADDDLRRDHPPVVVWWDADKTTPIKSAQSLGAHLLALTLTLPDRAMQRDDLAGDVRDRFDELAAALFDVEEVPSSVGVEGAQVRAAYRAFAHVFHPWAISPGAIENTPRVPRSPSFFAGREIAQISAEPIAFGAHRALSSSNGWVQKSGEIAYFDDVFSGLRFSLGGIVGEDSPESLTVIDNDAWLDPKTSIVHEAILAKWLHAHRSNALTKSGAVAIRVGEILDMRGAKKHHKGGYRREDKVDISSRLRRLEGVFVRGQYTDPQGKKHGVKGRLVNVTIDEELDLLGTGTPYAFLVKPGDATWSFYAESTYLTDYFMALARLDVSRSVVERMAYLIGRYLLHQWRIREAHQSFDQPFKVATMLEQARIEKEANPSSYSRFRENFDAALDHLAKIGVLSNWEYVAGDEEALPDRGWFAKWVDYCRVVLRPPDSVLEHGRLRAAARSERVKALAGRKSRGRKQGK